MSERWTKEIAPALFDLFLTNVISCCDAPPAGGKSIFEIQTILTKNGWQDIIWSKFNNFCYARMFEHLISPWVVDMKKLDNKFRDEILIDEIIITKLELEKNVQTANYIHNNMKRRAVNAGDDSIIRQGFVSFIEKNFKIENTASAFKKPHQTESTDTKKQLVLRKHLSYTTKKGKSPEANIHDFDVAIPNANILAFIGILHKYIAYFLDFKKFNQLSINDVVRVTETMIDWIYDSQPLRSTLDSCCCCDDVVNDEVYIYIIEKVALMAAKDSISKFKQTLSDPQGLTRRAQNDAENIVSLQNAVRAYKVTVAGIEEANQAESITSELSGQRK
jgi:hypothetical protein